MSLSKELLDQALHLVNREPRKPKQGSLRRAISTAYYALFHLLGESAAKRFSPAMRSHVRRALEHGRMKQAAVAVMNLATSSGAAKGIFSGVAVSPDLSIVASAFVGLQKARHDADYVLSPQTNKADALQLVQMAQGAFAAWKRIEKQPDAEAFVVALFFWNDKRQ